MSDVVLVATVAALPACLVAVGNLVLGVLADRRAGAERAANQAESNTKLDHITVLTNSTLTTANKRIAELESMMEHLLTERTASRVRELETKTVAERDSPP